MTKIIDMPKLESPFVREVVDGNYIVTDKIVEGFEWVFEDESVMAIEKLHGTNVSIEIKDGVIVGTWNRTERIPFFNKGKTFITEGILNSFQKRLYRISWRWPTLRRTDWAESQWKSLQFR